MVKNCKLYSPSWDGFSSRFVNKGSNWRKCRSCPRCRHDLVSYHASKSPTPPLHSQNPPLIRNVSKSLPVGIHLFYSRKLTTETAQWLHDCIMENARFLDVQTKRRVCFHSLLPNLWKRSGLILFTLEMCRLMYRRTSMFALNISRRNVFTIWDNREQVLPKTWSWSLDRYQLFTVHQPQNK